MNNRRVGAEKEETAVAYLMNKGYIILKQNYRTTYGEIDIIAKRDSMLVFCEIMYRSGNDYGDPLAAVDRRKQKRISRVALYYYTEQGITEDTPCCFDVIGIYGDGTIRHIENAFDFQ